jgi:hypothetical protein
MIDRMLDGWILLKSLATETPALSFEFPGFTSDTPGQQLLHATLSLQHYRCMQRSWQGKQQGIRRPSSLFLTIFMAKLV